MRAENIKDRIKPFLPTPLRVLLRGLLNYLQRIARWPIILWQVRGVRAVDECRLLLSALASPVLSLKELLQWQDPVLLFDTEVRVPGIGLFHLRKKCDDLWHVLPWRERRIVQVLRRLLKPGDVFIDAGANIGVYAVLASGLVGRQGRVLAVEMMPDTAQRLIDSIRLNQLENVQVIERALSQTAGETVTAVVTPGKFGQARIEAKHENRKEERVLHVQTTTLDALSEGHAVVRLIKMDLEGAELSAIHGGANLLSRADAVIYESWNRRRGANDPVESELTALGFVVESLDGNNRLAVRSGLINTDVDAV